MKRRNQLLATYHSNYKEGAGLPPKFFIMQIWTNSNPLGEIDQHEYDLVFEGNSIQLLNSNNDQWNEPGSLSAELIDDGNGIEIHLEDQDDNPIFLNYHEAFQILSLLLIIRDSKMEIRETKTILSV